MRIYESGEYNRDKLFELRKKNRCKQCGGMLNVFLDVDKHLAYVACNTDQSHEGIEREAAEPFQLNILTKREELMEQLGEQKATALEKYEGVVSLSRTEAMEILKTIWEDAPEIEVKKAAIICHQYGLNPLMKHIFLIPYKKRNKKGEVVGEEWVTVQGISSRRLIARRKHNYSYLDLTPRRMTEEEQTRINGEVDDSKVWAITKLKDVETSAEALGVGSWPAGEEPYGVEKGNSKLHMACIHSERDALDRLYPADMPHGIEVMEEKYIEAKYTLIAEGGEARVAPAAEGGKEKTEAVAEPTEGEESPKIAGMPPAEADKVIGEGFSLDMTWLNESLKTLKWSELATKSFLASHYKVDTKGTLADVLKRLTREQAEQFTKEIQSRLESIQQKLL